MDEINYYWMLCRFRDTCPAPSIKQCRRCANAHGEEFAARVMEGYRLAADYRDEMRDAHTLGVN